MREQAMREGVWDVLIFNEYNRVQWWGLAIIFSHYSLAWGSKTLRLVCGLGRWRNKGEENHEIEAQYIRLRDSFMQNSGKLIIYSTYSHFP